MFIKILDESLALKLKKLGFSYTTETINKNQTVYVFEQSPKLTEVLNKKFFADKVVVENKMRF